MADRKGNAPAGRSRIPVDFQGAQTIDPTKNVLDLVQAESKYQDAMRDAESKRIDQLAELRQTYEKRIADMLAESVRSTSTLVSNQLVQFQATFDGRVSKLEEFRWSSSGRSSIADPAMAEAIANLTATIANMQKTESGVGGQRKGSADSSARLLAIVVACAAVAGPFVSLLVAFMVVRGH
jgi:hypothetical protein